MKKRICNVIFTITLIIPWTILYLREFDWALQSPMAEILIYGYGTFMILSGVFAILAYTKGNVKNKWMQALTVINGIYAVGAAALLLMSIPR